MKLGLKRFLVRHKGDENELDSFDNKREAREFIYEYVQEVLTDKISELWVQEREKYREEWEDEDWDEDECCCAFHDDNWDERDFWNKQKEYEVVDRKSGHALRIFTKCFLCRYVDICNDYNWGADYWGIRITYLDNSKFHISGFKEGKEEKFLAELTQRLNDEYLVGAVRCGIKEKGVVWISVENLW